MDDSEPARRSAATELRESIVAVNQQMRRHRPDHGLTLNQMQLLAEVSRAGVTTPAELGVRLGVRVQSLTDSINALESRELIARRPDEVDRRRQLTEITPQAPNYSKPIAPSATRGSKRPCATISRSSSSTW